jgi:hypothetical protein
MATLTLGLTSTPVSGSRAYTLSDADVDRWIAALRVLYKMPSATKAQVLAAWAARTVDLAKRQVRKVERDVAEKAARDAINDIVAT